MKTEIDRIARRLQMIAAHVADRHPLEARELEKHAQALYRFEDAGPDLVAVVIQEGPAAINESHRAGVRDEP